MIDKLKAILERSAEQLMDVSELLVKLNHTLEQLQKIMIAVNVVNVLTLLAILILIIFK